MTQKEPEQTSESVIRRTLSKPGAKTAGLYIYLGEPSKVVVERVAGKIGRFVPDFTGRINTADFVHNAAGKICECDCFCSCACDCTCNCDCVCYCDCNCPCLCQSACNDYRTLEDIRFWSQEMNLLRDRLNIRFGDIAQIIESFAVRHE